MTNDQIKEKILEKPKPEKLKEHKEGREEEDTFDEENEKKNIIDSEADMRT
eukprot:CAMPEP_0170500324 /NCGR_PEP_ID=MMETSP0208-20121228/34442_1 /TAXON_ID=197538 /ORGANISM="Strombidium inclinatum, Strain S3" /LENGTH=50 /DNA_ID=CAMNT_0010778305 /DNA_START=669 /DNA_END=821 /DNA_ORIENTATION=-